MADEVLLTPSVVVLEEPAAFSICLVGITN